MYIVYYIQHIYESTSATAASLSDEIFTTLGNQKPNVECVQCALTGIYNATVPDLGLMLYIDIAIQPGKAKGRRSFSCY